MAANPGMSDDGKAVLRSIDGKFYEVDSGDLEKYELPPDRVKEILSSMEGGPGGPGPGPGGPGMGQPPMGMGGPGGPGMGMGMMGGPGGPGGCPYLASMGAYGGPGGPGMGPGGPGAGPGGPGGVDPYGVHIRWGWGGWGPRYCGWRNRYCY